MGKFRQILMEISELSVAYDIRREHWRINNKIKIKFTLSVNTIKIFISCNENIRIFTRASHS